MTTSGDLDAELALLACRLMLQAVAVTAGDVRACFAWAFERPLLLNLPDGHAAILVL